MNMWADEQRAVIKQEINRLLDARGIVVAQELVDAVRAAFNAAGLPYQTFCAADLKPLVGAETPQAGFDDGWLLK